MCELFRGWSSVVQECMHYSDDGFCRAVTIGGRGPHWGRLCPTYGLNPEVMARGRPDGKLQHE